MSGNNSIFYEAFIDKVKRFPKKVSLVVDDYRFTFSELENAFEKFRRQLLTNIELKNSKIVVISEAGILLPIVALIASRDAATLIPVASGLKPDQISKIFEIADPDVVLVTQTLAQKIKDSRLFAQYGENVVVVESSVSLTITEDRFTRSLKGDLGRDACSSFIINFTSGSTGVPKPVCVAEGTKFERITCGTQDLFDVDASDITLISTPQYHSLGLRQSLLPLVTGGTGVIMSHFSASNWLSVVEKHQITFTIGVPTQLNDILRLIKKEDRARLASLQTLVSSSAQFSAASRRLCDQKFNCRVFECYGASEIGIASTLEISNSSADIQSVGYPAKYAQITIFDTKKPGAIAKTGEIGEIGVSSPLAFSHYHGLPELTDATHSDEYFLTGDLGFFSDDGELIFVGRKSDVIKTSGISVYPIDIESCCNEMPDIVDSCAVGFIDRLGEERVGLAVVTSGIISKDKIFRHLITRLAPWQLPRTIIQLNDLPKTPIGKLDRRAIGTTLELA